jgi:hypothetical protein
MAKQTLAIVPKIMNRFIGHIPSTWFLCFVFLSGLSHMKGGESNGDAEAILVRDGSTVKFWYERR